MSAHWSHDFFLLQEKNTFHENIKTLDLQQHLNLHLFNFNQYKEVTF